MKAEKIPCSVSLLTLNAATDLPTCLEALADFAEIIVCDGNSTDRTREIAEQFGAKVLKQYDTDEPNVRCVMDKAAVRQRAMDASTLSWRIFLDADDPISKETVEEIRRITTDPDSKHWIWRLPSRVFIAGKEVKHYATYPAYQTRLVHERVGARFEGPVHDHLSWDTEHFSVGTMRSHYDFHWDKERIQHFRSYQDRYVGYEVETFSVANIRNFLRWGIWFRLRVIASYVLWRLPRMYLRYGFGDSMPLWIELEIVRYHVMILVRTIGKFFSTRRAWILAAAIARTGRLQIARIAYAALTWEAYGKTLVIGEERNREFVLRYVSKRRWHTFAFVGLMDDIDSSRGKMFDTVIMCAPHNPEQEAKARGILKDSGRLYFWKAIVG
jgi:glycosyltransferase involved in cell wall biosynthesis